MPRDFGVHVIGRKSHPIAAPSLRRTYRLSIVCHNADSSTIEAELARLFKEAGLTVESLSRDQTSHVFVRICALVASSIPERAALVRIVNQLAAEPTIRRLQWESVPTA